jgi:hypothetical protein
VPYFISKAVLELSILLQEFVKDLSRWGWAYVSTMACLSAYTVRM